MTANVSHYRPIVTIEQHIIEGQQRYPGATGEFSWLLSGITLATKIIQDRVRQAGLLDVLGPTGASNVQGEMIQKLDVIANETLMQCLGYRGNVGMMISEEDAEPRIVQDVGEEGRYVVLFDPLDGSSNIDVNVPIGTIFSILRRKPDVDRSDAMPHILQPGIQQVAAGYVLYGSSTVMVYTAGDGVHIFTLDPAIGAYVLTQENVQMPENGRTYSVNEAYALTFPHGVQKYLAWAKSEEAGGYSLRYVGSLVSDFHRTLLRGGVFLYPPTQKDRLGKLRLLYEANPIAFLAEQAGGLASDGRQRILEKQPQSIHERTPLIVGSRDGAKRVLSFWGG
ncbi:class 1 fructose-bisphosphatase [Candidatus Poribacteria bacterium]|nr:MAG: class 1 fructose-bisphosphatase [Candidatus Poribacteria bacterium]